MSKKYLSARGDIALNSNGVPDEMLSIAEGVSEMLDDKIRIGNLFRIPADG